MYCKIFISDEIKSFKIVSVELSSWIGKNLKYVENIKDLKKRKLSQGIIKEYY